MLIASLSLLLFSQTEASAEPLTSASSDQNDSFAPTVWKPTWVDQNNNGIADSLDHEIAERIENGTAQDFVSVTIMLKAAPTTQDANDFASSGGYLMTSPWTEATYGFGGMITYNEITDFTQRCHNVLLVEKEAVGKASLVYAAQQVGARTYVWNTMGLQGDSSASTAIVDSGIDGSHVDFLPGYGDKDFSKKIVGWDDEVGSTISPVDDNGHGSHVSGLAAGNGFFSADASGNAITTWGADLAPVPSSGTYTISGIMVNKTGTITIKVKWARTGTASLSALLLYFGDETLNPVSWAQVASVNTPNQNTFYSLTYNVDTPPLGSYDMYHVMLTMTAGTGHVYVALTMSWPYTLPSDGFTAWTGIAPQSKLVGVKVMNSLGSGTANELISGINWIIANRMSYHMTVASMSLGFTTEQTSVDSAVLNLVNSGVSVIVAAGNSGSGSNSIYTCGSVDEVITVAAMNQFDGITSYSSQGGTSRYTGKTTKPDITAPGGSFLGLPLFSVDTNSNDAEGGFTEIQTNDSAPLQGTSMAAPVISGCAQIVIQAMGGFVTWNWTRSQALQPKMILLMTATETPPNLREMETSSTSPTLNRGGKDVHEGYGRVNLDAAVDALLKSYTIGNVVTETLGRPPTLTDISVLGQKLAWARNVQLVSGRKYNFSLSVPAGADYDLYLYDSTGTTYGEPTIVAKSTNATTGGTEQFWVTAPYTRTYYVVVKRATETTGSGTFTLASSSPVLGPVSITLNTPGLPNASNVVHYTQNGTSKDGNIMANAFSDYIDTGTTLTIDNLIYASTTQRYITTDPTTFSITSSATFTVNYKTQYSIIVNSSHGAPTDSQWVSQGSTFIASVTSPTEIVAGDHQWVCTGYSLDAGPAQLGTSYTFTNVQVAHTIVFNWREQFYLTVNSAYGSPIGGGWYDSDATANAVLSTGTVSGGTGVQYIFTGWSDDASGVGLTSNAITMNSAKTATANWKTQCYLTTSSTYGAAGGAGWYDSGVSAYATVSPLVVAGDAETQYVFTSWGGDASGTTSPSNAITMNGPRTATANWKTQYYLNVSTNIGSVSLDSGWYDAGSTVTISTTAPSARSGEQYVWNGWTGIGSGNYTGTDNPASVTMNGSATEAASWTHQYMLMVTSLHGSSSPTSGWFEAGTSISAQVTSPITGSIITQYVCTGWAGTGSVPANGISTSVSFTMDQPSSITWDWRTEYLVTNLLIIAILAALTGSAIYLPLRRKQKRKSAAMTALK